MMNAVVEKLKSLNICQKGAKNSKNDVILLQKTLKTQKNVILPDEFVEFLYEYNGFNFMGGHIYGFFDKNTPTYNIIYENDEFFEENKLVLGENEFDYLAYNQNSKKYEILDKQDLEVLEEYINFEDGFFYIIKL